MKKRSLLIFVALALIPLILLAQISGPGSYSSVIMAFLRSTTAAAARTAIGAVNSGSGGALTNAVIYGSTSGSATFDSTGQLAIGNTTALSMLQIGTNSNTATPRQAITVGNGGYSVPSLPNSTANGDKLVTWNDSTGKAAIVQGLSYDMCFQSGGSAGAGFKWYSGPTSGTGTNEVMRLTSSGLLGIGTTVPEKALDINSATGAALQITYNDNNGSAANKVTFDVSSGGDLTVAPSGSDASFTGRLASTPTSSTLAAAATAIAVTANVMTITGDAGANTIATITGGLSGQILTLIFVDSLVTVTDSAAGTANTVNLSAAFTSTSNDTLTLVFNGTSWREVARSVN